jgi:hydrogenase maturation protease
MTHPAVLIIGVGNRYRSDDGVGPYVSDALVGSSGVRAVEHSGEGASLIDLWQGYQRVILIDAVCTDGAVPGTVYRMDARRSAIPSKFFNYSTHAFSVAEAIETARALDMLPVRFEVIGVAGKTFSSGCELTSCVRTAADELIGALRDDTGVTASVVKE